MALETFTLSDKKFSLRRAVESDLAAILELLANDPIRQRETASGTIDPHHYLKAFRTIDTDPAQILIVVIDKVDSVVGTMQLTLIPGLTRAGATRLNIEAVRVDERNRGNGLGTAMLKWAIAEGSRRGARLVQLTSDNARDDAHRFYERLGFSPSHTGFKLVI